MVLRVSCARTLRSRSMPDMPGMFQSVTRKSKLPRSSIGNAVVPSSASSVLVKPRSRNRFLMIRRIVEKSSTMRIFMSLFN
ncbi:hypothetical protein D3C71_1950360 [compost metagenome]